MYSSLVTEMLGNTGSFAKAAPPDQAYDVGFSGNLTTT